MKVFKGRIVVLSLDDMQRQHKRIHQYYLYDVKESILKKFKENDLIFLKINSIVSMLNNPML